jgi:hypothetical protein
MFKLKFYIWNAFWSSIIGLVVYIFAMFIFGWHNYMFKELIGSMKIGAVIGTVSLFFLFEIVLRLRPRPLLGYLSNFLVVGAMNIVGSIIYGLNTYELFTRYFFRSIWFVALIVSEALSIFLITDWYRRIILFQKKLELKKASLKSDDAP